MASTIAIDTPKRQALQLRMLETLVFTLYVRDNTIIMASPYLSRTIDQVLDKWSRDPDRKPLILRGARQTGKSSSVRAFGERFSLFLEVDLERHSDLALVRACSSPTELLEALRARQNVSRLPDRSLLFLDEIQESPDAIQWLRFFKEEHPELFVIGAGSLLELRLEERGFSFPVGRVTFRTLHPFSFLEFVRATGREVLAEALLAAEPAAPRRALHEQAMETLREYLLVGGMPEAVARWTDRRDPATVREVHADLLQAFAEDIHKYRGVRDLAYLEAAFENLHHHYGQRFKYQDFAPGYRSQLMKTALGRFEAAMLVTRVWPTSSLQLPLRIRPKSAPKLLPLDVGLALHSMGVPFGGPIGRPVADLLDGRAAEMFVGQQLLAAQAGPREALHFWVRETAHANAEVDYLIAGPGVPVPVEVKAGAAGTLRSIHQFLSRAETDTALRLSSSMRADESHEVKVGGRVLRYRLLSLPLYLAETIPALVAQLRGDGEQGHETSA